MCDFECQNEVTLNKHRNTKHRPISKLGPGTFGCSISVRKDKEEEAELLRKAWKENISEPFIKEKHYLYCDFCNYKCIKDKAMTKHMLKHKNCQKCTICGKVLNSDITLKNHMESEHSKCVDSEADNISLVHSKEEIPTDEQIAEILKMLEAYS